MSVLTLADAKTHLNMTSTADDVELQTIINAAEAAIAKRVGPLAPTIVTSRVAGCTDILALPITPVISLTSVTPVNGTALTITDFDATGGLVTYGAYWGTFPARRYDVTYTAGRTSVPDDLLLAVKEMVRHLWSASQRGSGRSTSGQAPPAAVPTFAMPYFVAELISPYLQAGLA